MKQFFKFTFAAMLGYIIAGFVLIVIFFSFLFSAISDAEDMFNDKKDTSVKENSILHLTFGVPIVDRATNNPFEEINFNTFEPKKEISLADAVKALRNAKDDTRIKGIYLDLSEVNVNMANMEEVKVALDDFKSSGKFIYSYSEFYNQFSYYVASISDSIFLNPYGDLEFKGLRTELAFFKGTLEKLEVDMQVIRGSNNKFKSAVEPFMYDKMSSANKEQMTLIINSFWDYLVGTVSESRGISKDELNKIADELLINSPEDAVKYKLVDAALYQDEVISILKSKSGIDEDDDLNLVSLKKYSKVKPKLALDEEKDGDKKDVEKPWEKKDKLAIIYASGEIRSGKSTPEVMGSETIAEAIKEAREDSTVKAIVFRVNSPGGSALASEVIWRETQLAKAEKPFIVSMGRVAASGGYYISCGADKIYADASTITGSIGVFGLIPNMQKMFNNKLGVTFDGVKTNDNADIMSVTLPLTDYQYSYIQKSVDRIYNTFTQRVADGRSTTQAFVDSIGQGRVWTGNKALEIGLVDEIGTLEDAVAYATEVSGVEDPRIKNYPKQEDPFKKFLEDFSMNAKMYFVDESFKQELELYKQVTRIKEMKGVQAFMPYYFEIN